ncbi:helix-turn-helix domain-containing protein (plasmid) [Escherichia coli]|nr:helix-turn-helix domain-containing protein [Escherichia coli]NQF56193.1 helix-turn-helix domain-containing protein [Escherichia coli]
MNKTKGCLIANFATVPQEAKLKGIKFGRRRTVDRNVVLTLHQKGTGATEIAHQLSIARSTVYKILEDERAS